MSVCVCVGEVGDGGGVCDNPNTASWDFIIIIIFNLPKSSHSAGLLKATVMLPLPSD